MAGKNAIAAAAGAIVGNTRKKFPVYDEKTGKIITYVDKELVYDSPQEGKDVWKIVGKDKVGISAKNLGGTSGGGTSKEGKGPSVRSKSEKDCVKGKKGCGPND